MNRLLQQPEFHVERVLPRLLQILRAEDTADVVGEADGGDLVPIGVGVETEASGDSQSSAPEGGEIGRLGTKTRRISGCAA